MKREDIFIEAEELLTKLDDPNLRIYDANILFFASESDPSTAHDKYLQGHIPRAAFFKHDDFSDSEHKYEFMALSGEKLMEQIGCIGISAQSQVVFYAPGMLPAATRAWWLLRYAGHNNVRVLNGGLDGWGKAGGSIEQVLSQYPATTFQGELRPLMFASKEDVITAQEDNAVCIEYALPLTMYGGQHIPGSAFWSMDLMDGLDWLQPDDEFVDKLDDDVKYERLITYCGGGIAATVSAITHMIAGKDNVAVYDGSLMEWMGEGLPTVKGGQ